MDTAHTWLVRGGLTLGLARPRVMAILNITPDSFHDGSALYRDGRPDAGAIRDAAARALGSGADVLDIGGESTRPGAAPVSADEELARVVPAIHAVRSLPGGAGSVPITIDTTKASVARAALDAGADAINDISAGTTDEDMLALAALRRAGIILMHRLRPPAQDSYSDRYASTPRYHDVVGEVREFLRRRIDAASRAGVERASILIDPGLGFGKSIEDNLALIARTGELRTLGRPVLSALSRKSFVGRVSLGRDSTPAERLPGTLALTIAHLHAGARLFRVHDVPECAAALRAAWAVASPTGSTGIPPWAPQDPGFPGRA